MGTHLIIRKEEAGQQVRGLSWKEKRPRSSTPMRCSCSYGRGIPRIIMKELKTFFCREEGMGTVEIILIIVVLVGLVVIFRKQLNDLVTRIFSQINADSSSILG